MCDRYGCTCPAPIHHCALSRCAYLQFVQYKGTFSFVRRTYPSEKVTLPSVKVKARSGREVKHGIEAAGRQEEWDDRMGSHPASWYPGMGWMGRWESPLQSLSVGTRKRERRLGSEASCPPRVAAGRPDR